jgi:hypothetical protein
VFHLNVAYVAMAIHICFMCFRCFRLMLQVFYLNVVKIDLGVVYVVMVIHACLDVSIVDLGGSTCCNCVVPLLRGSPRRLVRVHVGA